MWFIPHILQVPLLAPGQSHYWQYSNPEDYGINQLVQNTTWHICEQLQYFPETGFCGNVFQTHTQTQIKSMAAVTPVHYQCSYCSFGVWESY